MEYVVIIVALAVFRWWHIDYSGERLSKNFWSALCQLFFLKKLEDDEGEE